MSKSRLLVVDDSDSIRFAVKNFFEDDGSEVEEADSLRRAMDLCATRRFDAAIVDYKLPDGTALDLLAQLKETGASLPVVVLTGHGSIDLAVRAIKEGAEHFLTKPVELPTLQVVLKRITEGQRAKRREAATRTRQGRRAPDPFVGKSAAIQRLAEEARIVAAADSPILLQGETGAGKGVLANWLHANSLRNEETFVDLNCAGLSPQFLETELFGHERGAFTGAVSAKTGLFELAHKGTLFLDEIGDVDQQVQPKLLKVIEEQRFRRLGDVRDRVVDVRLIAATHQNIEGQIREKRFRSDLYFRISTLPLHLPALRERAEDIPLLARQLLETIRADLGKPSIHLSPDAEAALMGYSWPGNVRELRNVLERAVLLARSDELKAADFRFTSGAMPVSAPPMAPQPLAAAPAAPAGANAQPSAVDGHAASPDSTVVSLEENEKRYLESVLRSLGGRVEDAAKALGLPRSSLYHKIKRLGIRPSKT